MHTTTSMHRSIHSYLGEQYYSCRQYLCIVFIQYAQQLEHDAYVMCGYSMTAEAPPSPRRLRGSRAGVWPPTEKMRKQEISLVCIQVIRAQYYYTDLEIDKIRIGIRGSIVPSGKRQDTVCILSSYSSRVGVLLDEYAHIEYPYYSSTERILFIGITSSYSQ